MSIKLALLRFVVLAALGASVAQAAVHTSLNLRYNDPIDPTEGGIWTLVALSDDPNSSGIADLSVTFTDLPAAATLNPNIGGSLAINTLGGQTQLIYSQDPNAFVPNVGHVGGPSDIGPDPLFNPIWNNASVIASGAIPSLAARPAFSLDYPATAHVNVGDAFVPASIGLTSVRGDSVAVDGLHQGDSTRNFVVNGNDLNVWLVNFNTSGTNWDSGDHNDDGVTDGDDKLVLTHFNTPTAGDINEVLPNPPGPASISLTFTFRSVNASEIADGAPAGTVFEFFATTDQDILSIDSVDLVGVPLYNNALGSNTSPPNPSFIPTFPSLGADSWITTPGPTTTALPGNFQSANVSWFDTSRDGPQTDFRFAQLTIPSTAGNGFEFAGRFNVRDGLGGVVSQEFTFPLLQSGDFDSDGDVDGEDFLKWQRGESFDPGSAADLAAWELFYGTGGTPLAAQSSVPEPVALALAVLSLIGIVTSRCRLA